MKSIFFREEKHYSITDLSRILEVSEDVCMRIVSVLKAHGILKTANSDSSSLDFFTETDDKDIPLKPCDIFKFRFVGVIVIEDYILYCYPKYVSNEGNALSELKIALKAIKKYSFKSTKLNYQNDYFGNIIYNELAVSLFLLSDYYTNGLYSTQVPVYDTNGLGEIDWQKSIDDSIGIIIDDIPYYLDLFTISSQINENDYYRLLHECVLSKCSHFLSDTGILELFDLRPAFLTYSNINDYGNPIFIENKLKKRINTEFVTQKQITLKSILTYITHEESKTNEERFNYWGSFSFNLVWEEACKSVFSNKLYNTISECFPNKSVTEEYRDSILIDLIDRPEWYVIDESTPQKSKQATLRPDLITLCNINNEMMFIICDAKYYNIVLCANELLEGNPGVEDVTKQYLYQLAYKDFFEKEEITRVFNCFIMPSDEEYVKNVGYVSLSFLKNLGLSDIQIIKYPANLLLNNFIQNKKDSILLYLK